MIDAMESLHHRLREGKWADLGNGVGTYGPFLALVPPEKLAVLTIHEVVNAVVKHGNAGVPLASLLMNIAEAVRTEVCKLYVCVCVGGGGCWWWMLLCCGARTCVRYEPLAIPTHPHPPIHIHIHTSPIIYNNR